MTWHSIVPSYCGKTPGQHLLLREIAPMSVASQFVRRQGSGRTRRVKLVSDTGATQLISGGILRRSSDFGTTESARCSLARDRPPRLAPPHKSDSCARQEELESENSRPTCTGPGEVQPHPPERSCYHIAARRIYCDNVRSKEPRYARRIRWQRQGIRGQNPPRYRSNTTVSVASG